MIGKVAATITVGLCLLGQSASAHRIDEYLQATVLSLKADRVQASMRLVPGVLVAPAVIAAIDANRDGVFSDDEEQAYAQRVLEDLSITLDGQGVKPTLLSWSFPPPVPMREGVGEIHIEYALDLPPGGRDRHLVLANHHLGSSSVYLMNAEVPEDRAIQIIAQKRNAQQSIYELDYRQAPPAANGLLASWAGVRAWLNDLQFASLFRLGMRHIGEGTDHLLFLLTLLLPAPLVVSGSRWGPPAPRRQSLLRILGIVTAFTIGHSVTLALAALGIFTVPSRPIEVLIAVSIFVSSLHALRPVIAGKEVWVAGFFGLIHGLAFAVTLERLGLARWQRVAGIFAFNLGIETMQLLVVAAILPSLMLMSGSRAYTIFRTGGAVFAGAASVGWIVERLFDVEMPVDPIVNALAHRAVWIAAALFLTALCLFRMQLDDRPLRPSRRGFLSRRSGPKRPL